MKANDLISFFGGIPEPTFKIVVTDKQKRTKTFTFERPLDANLRRQLFREAGKFADVSMNTPKKKGACPPGYERVRDKGFERASAMSAFINCHLAVEEERMNEWEWLTLSQERGDLFDEVSLKLMGELETFSNQAEADQIEEEKNDSSATPSQG